MTLDPIANSSRWVLPTGIDPHDLAGQQRQLLPLLASDHVLLVGVILVRVWPDRVDVIALNAIVPATATSGAAVAGGAAIAARAGAAGAAASVARAASAVFIRLLPGAGFAVRLAAWASMPLGLSRGRPFKPFSRAPTFAQGFSPSYVDLLYLFEIKPDSRIDSETLRFRLNAIRSNLERTAFDL